MYECLSIASLVIEQRHSIVHGRVENCFISYRVWDLEFIA
jgi:hypothetical protein